MAYRGKEPVPPNSPFGGTGIHIGVKPHVLSAKPREQGQGTPSVDGGADPGSTERGAEASTRVARRKRVARPNALFDAARKALREVAEREGQKAPFRLSGRGHEARVTLDRRLVAIVRSVALPVVVISGHGANYHYPYRVFKRAAGLLRRRLGWSPIEIAGTSAYWIEIHRAQR